MQKHRGFTLIELMGVLVVMGILISFAVPAYSNLVKDSRLRNAANDTYAALRYARMNAVQTKKDTYVSFGDLSNCASDGAFTVWVDYGRTGACVAGDEVRLLESFNSSITATPSIDTFVFRRSGLLSGLAAGTTQATISFCDTRSGESGYQITVSGSGQASIADLACS